MQDTNTTCVSEWQSKKTTQKGNAAEDIAARILRSMGYDVYSHPLKLNESHEIDFFMIDRYNMKVIMVDAKCKAKRVYYPDSGIEFKHYISYKKYASKHNMDVFIVFVDEKYGKIYGNYLSILETVCKPITTKDFKFTEPQESTVYPRTESGKGTEGVIYFPLALMNKMGDLSNEEIAHLRSLTENVDYTIEPNDITTQLIGDDSWIYRFKN